MKSATLHSLMTAKAVLGETKPLVSSGNAHSCSAGLILLQDALELVVLAVLLEKEVDQQKNIESKSFDELVGELRKLGLQLPKSGTIKALNKQRVITKHYGQLAEPATVRNYYEAAHVFIDEILRQVIGRTLGDVMLTDLLQEGESKQLLMQAAGLKDIGKYFECLIEIRKALFVEIEQDYAIHQWVDVEGNGAGLGLLGLGRGGLKAPYWTRNKRWISEHVRRPTDYVQVDPEQLRLDAMEWGVRTSDVENLRRLTPAVFRASLDSKWSVDYELSLPPNEGTLHNCVECLDAAIEVIRKKKEHEQARRWPGRQQPHKAPAIYIGHQVYKAARTTSEVMHIVQEGFLYTMHRIVSGFDPNETFYLVTGNEAPDDENPYGKNHISGYLLKFD
ncbi:hypothetical protein [Desulfonatronum lacustre]|uniref:hypothetical protein n=1 Tax=Desulfonatronum lacustre TaxID=66849 RepID=UPI00048DBEAA|nr:hypothetical protein [Desulfonatronum lacustre]